MTRPTAQQQQQATARIAPLLAGGTAIASVTPSLLASLATIGVSTAAAKAALTLIGASSAPTVLPLGPAARATTASENFYRAAYLVAAGRRTQARLDSGQGLRQAVLAERPLFAAHREARANRARAAAVVDAASQLHGHTLGWHAVMDEKTSPECRAANGKDFSVFSRPLIGWPGSVHPHCRCKPGPAFGTGSVDGTATQTERRESVAAVA